MRATLTLFALPFLVAPSLAQWTPLVTGMLSNRSMTSINGDLYVVSFPHGVKKSVAGTGPWNEVNTGLPPSGTNYFVQSVGTDGAYLYAGTESGIYRSTVGTDTWSSINGTLTASSTVYANKFFSLGGNILAVFTGSIGQGGGIWRSSNFGNTWLIGHSGMGSNVQVNHVTLVGTTLYASTSTGLYTSIDNAQSWVPLPSVNYATYSLVSFNSTLVIASSFGMRYSVDNGGSWSDATGDPANVTDGELIAFDGALVCVLNQVGCLRSTDSGATWSDWNEGFSDVDAQAQEEFFLLGNTLYCTALFDVYSMLGTGQAIGEGTTSSGLVLFPTVVEDGFTLRAQAGSGTLCLLDASGRQVGRVPTTGARDQWIDRGDLPPGLYHVRFVPSGGGATQHLGRIVMR